MIVKNQCHEICQQCMHAQSNSKHVLVIAKNNGGIKINVWREEKIFLVTKLATDVQLSQI